MAAVAAGAHEGAAAAGPATSAHRAIASAAAISKRWCIVLLFLLPGVVRVPPLPAKTAVSSMNLRWARQGGSKRTRSTNHGHQRRAGRGALGATSNCASGSAIPRASGTYPPDTDHEHVAYVQAGALIVAIADDPAGRDPRGRLPTSIPAGAGLRFEVLEQVRPSSKRSARPLSCTEMAVLYLRAVLTPRPQWVLAFTCQSRPSPQPLRSTRSTRGCWSRTRGTMSSTPPRGERAVGGRSPRRAAPPIRSSPRPSRCLSGVRRGTGRRRLAECRPRCAPGAR